MSSKRNRYVSSNRNSFIISRPNYNAKVGAYTATAGRDQGTLNVAARTLSNNSTEVVITRKDGREWFVLSGSEARTLQRVLNTHYENVS